jgi:hypothetical protein
VSKRCLDCPRPVDAATNTERCALHHHTLEHADMARLKMAASELARDFALRGDMEQAVWMQAQAHHYSEREQREALILRQLRGAAAAA